MSTFWSIFVTVIVLGTIAGCAALSFGQPKIKWVLLKAMTWVTTTMVFVS